MEERASSVGARPTAAWSRLSRTGGILLALAALGFVAGFAAFAARIELAERRPSRHADGIVALTGGSDRVADAIGLLAEGHADRLLITGVNSATTREDFVRRIPGARSWVQCCIDLGYRAADTIGNAQETADWVRTNNIRSLIVVTSNYHMPRALAEMAFELPDIDLQPYAVVPDRIRPTSFSRTLQLGRLVLGEYVKFMTVKLRQAVEGRAASPDVLHLATRRSS